MNKLTSLIQVGSFATVAVFAMSAGAAQAESAIRGAYAEVRANSSSQAASFEQVLPDNFYFSGTDRNGDPVRAPRGFTIVEAPEEGGGGIEEGGGAIVIPEGSVPTNFGEQAIGTFLTVDVADTGTNQSNLLLLGVNAGIPRSTSVDHTDTPLAATSLEDSIAEQVQNLTSPTDEDVTGLIRAFVGSNGNTASTGLE